MIRACVGWDLRDKFCDRAKFEFCSKELTAGKFIKFGGGAVMIEQVFKLSVGNEKAVEKVLFDENINYIHMVFNRDEGVPEHFTNSNVYMTVVRGKLSIGLGDQETHEYEAGTLLKIPVHTKMNIKNPYTDTLELIVVKAPAPGN